MPVGMPGVQHRFRHLGLILFTGLSQTLSQWSGKADKISQMTIADTTVLADASSVIAGDIAENKLSGIWPADTPEASQSAWSAGHQPKPLEAWPREANGQPAPCWKTEPLQDVAKGWPGQCMGLRHTPLNAHGTCRISCLNNPFCSVWQFSKEGGCYQGQGVYCDTRNGLEPLNVLQGQRIQHGKVRVLTELMGIQVQHLRKIGVWHNGGGAAAGVEMCRSYCYSDITCQYWQYGEEGCWVEDPNFQADVTQIQYPLTMKGGATKTTEFANTVVAGEYIMHYCPATRTAEEHEILSDPAEQDLRSKSAWRYVPYVIVGILASLLTVCLAGCLWDAQQINDPSKQRFYKMPPLGSESDLEGSEYGGFLEAPASPGGNAGGSTCSMLSPKEGSRQNFHHFTVQVDRTGGSKVGLDMGYEDHKTLLVKRIQADGLLAVWNIAHPGFEVLVGDRIVEVNGMSGRTRGVRALMDEMRTHQVLNLSVRREVFDDDEEQVEALPRQPVQPLLRDLNEPPSARQAGQLTLPKAAPPRNGASATLPLTGPVSARPSLPLSLPSGPSSTRSATSVSPSPHSLTPPQPANGIQMSVPQMGQAGSQAYPFVLAPPASAPAPVVMTRR